MAGQGKSVTGFIHDVGDFFSSTPKKDKKSRRMFRAVLQDKHEYRRIVVFDETKKRVFDEAARDQKMVEIMNFSDSIQNPGEIMVYSTSTLNPDVPPSKRLRLAYKPETKQFTEIQQCIPSDRARYNLQVKVIQLEAPDYNSGPFEFQQAVFADSTGTVASKLWKSKINRFSLGESYYLEKVKVDMYNEEKTLRFDLDSSIRNSPNEVQTTYTPTEKQVHGELQSSTFQTNHICGKCGDMVLDKNIKANFFTCLVCNRNNRSSLMKIQEKIMFAILVDNEEQEFSMIKQDLPDEVRDLDAESIEDWLLTGKKTLSLRGGVVVNCKDFHFIEPPVVPKSAKSGASTSSKSGSEN